MTDNPFVPSTSGLQPNAGLLGTPGAIVATSVSSVAIATGTLSFTVQQSCAFAPGMPIFIVDSANTANWLWGTVTSYNPTSGILIVNIQQVSGSGTIATWQISLAGVQGPQGQTGSSGGGINSGTAGQMTYYGATGTVLSGNPNANISSGILTLGQPSTVAGGIVLQGGTSGSVTIGVPAIAGSTSFVLPANDGAAGSLLQSDGAGNTSWVVPAASGSSLTLLATQNVSNVAGVVFNSTYITNKYSKYILEYNNVYWTSGGVTKFGLEVSADNGGTWQTTSYANLGQVSGGGSTSQVDLLAGGAPGAGSATSIPTAGTVKFSNPSSGRYTQFLYETSFIISGGGLGYARGTGIWESNTAVNAIQILADANLWGNFSLYGLSQ